MHACAPSRETAVPPPRYCCRENGEPPQRAWSGLTFEAQIALQHITTLTTTKPLSRKPEGVPNSFGLRDAMKLKRYTTRTKTRGSVASSPYIVIHAPEGGKKERKNKTTKG